MQKVKIKNSKAQVKKSATLVSSTFQRISLGLKQIVLLFIETGFINSVLSKIDLYIQQVCSFSFLLFDFSPVKRQEKLNSLVRKHKIICFMFRNTVIYSVSCFAIISPTVFYPWRERGTLATSERGKSRPAKFDILSVISRHRKNH